ncbi:hypothetical protein M5X11_39235 [Paenibacillus alginolyticus]|uniref:hypothetical protein n=1 Tax=Paenibacillus alginolyticus TaxID=59839 RepID=UPI0004001039|nr:hypothetical protein [Paenibacillus alginolyticus]MCY9670854.1 hypothetical protein [Paenibacillus alginolyticus]
MENIEKFIGSWTNHSGHILKIYKINHIEVRVDFYPHLGCEPINRELLGRRALSVNMKAILQEQGLQIELGEEGLGPTLELAVTMINNKDYLEPQVVMGLYDDYEDDFGVPWILPLSYFEKLENE